ncbi:MAG TPA: hypothetical protein VML91_26980 [Burkholderiales bacterium]|nr:hypothetical protein [Burkholderiales bacterium]
MNIPFRVQERAERNRTYRRNWPVASKERPEWLELAEEAILYFGVTLSPVLIAILLYQLGVIA